MFSKNKLQNAIMACNILQIRHYGANLALQRTIILKKSFGIHFELMTLKIYYLNIKNKKDDIRKSKQPITKKF